MSGPTKPESAAPTSASPDAERERDVDAVARRLESAPIDADAMTLGELAEVEACLADEPGPGRSTVDVLGEVVARAKRGG